MTTLDLSHKKQRFDDAVFVASNLEHCRLTTERELQDLKWVGYRFMTPLAATKLFYDIYRSLRVGYVREHKDKDLADNLPMVPFSDFVKNPKNLAMAWSARQIADTFGVPYEIYIEFGFWFWSRRASGGRRNVPQINQLGFSDATETAWRAEFNKFLSHDRLWAASRSLADVPQLHPDAFEGTAEQIAARAFIVDLCGRSECSWPRAIEMWCYSYPIVTPDDFAAIVPPEVLEASVATALLGALGPTPVSDAALAGILWPSCHGMPSAMDTRAEACRKCCSSASCNGLASMVKSEVLRNTGHEEPRQKALRKAPNERQKRYRAKKKAATASAGVSSSLTATSPLPEVTLP
ncbi:hypothetical protein [Devosia aquimaris]|uniref:hypothetical protein n=1 Tax=Devosia aquimaris TaxID=2866214 RepID=UPI001CD0E9D4|nr:hypothetical protein [Devosia sp. CJK-A8-3]